MMEVKHNEHTPVFIIGHGRSGTSILSVLLREYLKIGFGTESQFIVRYFKGISRYGDLTKDRNLKRLIHDITQERWFERCKKFGFIVDADKILKELPERSYKGVLESVFMQFAKHNQMERWGDKTPEYCYHLPVLKQLFPDAKFIHIIRDGRDVALSVVRIPSWGAKNIYCAARNWKDTILLIRDFAKCLNRNQFLEMRYEDLSSVPRTQFLRLIDFLEIDNTDGKLIDFISENIDKDLTKGNFNKWKEQFSESEQILFEKLACDVLEEYGYETRIKEIQRFSLSIVMFWKLHNFLKKAISPGYWKNIVYSVKVRLKMIMS